MGVMGAVRTRHSAAREETALNEEEYLADVRKHRDRVADILGNLRWGLRVRADGHDASKMREPELSGFREHLGRLREVEYGSKEYDQIRAAMAGTMAHHYTWNRHHPEHFTNGIQGMDLMDVCEMLADWKAASERGGGGAAFAETLEIQRERFGISDQLFQVLLNTYRHGVLG